ncbi:hypothetical protein [Gilliamella sp. CG25]|uniref:hypothetical protein n=1 Tax=unclassified Gilliamella TaxID=2685620 RepID=UPI0039885007
MHLEQYLIKIGVDISQVNNLTKVTAFLEISAMKLSNIGKVINTTLNNAINDASQSNEKVAESSEKAKSKFEILKQALTSITAAAKNYGEKLISAFNSAIDKAEELAGKKNLLFSISKSELAQVKKYKIELEKSGLAIDSIKTKIALGLLPRVTDLVISFNKWLKANKELIAKGINVVISVVSNFIQVIKHAFEFIDMIISKSIGWENAIIALSVAWAVLNRAMLFSPIGLVIGLIAGLLLIIDDFMVFLKGGKSQFAPFWQACIDNIKNAITWWQNLDKNWKSIIFAVLGYLLLLGGKIAWVSAKAKLITSISNAILSIGNALKTLGNLVKIIKTIGSAIKTLTSIMIANPILAIITAIALAAYLIYDNWDFLVSFFSDFWNKVTNFFKNGIKDILMYFGMSEENAEKTVNAIGATFDAILDLITAPFKAAWELVKSLFTIWTDDSTSTTEKIGQTFEAITDFITAPFKAAWEFIKGLFEIWGVDVTSFIDNLGKTFSGILDCITQPFKDGLKWIEDKFFAVIDKMKSKIKGVLSFFGFGNDKDEQAQEENLKATNYSATQNLALVSTDVAKAGGLSALNKNVNNNSEIIIHNTMNVTTPQNGLDQVCNLVDNAARRINDNTVTAMGSN